MDQSRRSFAMWMGALSASSVLWDHAVAEVNAQGAVSDELVRAMLDGQGGPSIFADPERFAELKSALGRTAQRLATMRAFPVPADIPPAVGFRRD